MNADRPRPVGAVGGAGRLPRCCWSRRRWPSPAATPLALGGTVAGRWRWRCSPPTARSPTAAARVRCCTPWKRWRQQRTGAAHPLGRCAALPSAPARDGGRALTAAFLLSSWRSRLRAGVMPLHIGCRQPLRSRAGGPDAAAGLDHRARVRPPAFRGPSRGGVAAGAGAGPLRRAGGDHRRADDAGAARSARLLSRHDRGITAACCSPRWAPRASATSRRRCWSPSRWAWRWAGSA